MGIFDKKDGGNVTADDINSATKAIRQLSDITRLADVVLKLGNVQQTVSAAESDLVGLRKSQEAERAKLSTIEAECGKKKNDLDGIRSDIVSSEKTLAEINSLRIKTEQDRNSSVINFEQELILKNKTLESLTANIEVVKIKAAKIIEEAELVKAEARKEKKEAEAVTKAVEDKRKELAAVQKEISDAKAAFKNQFESIGKSL